jgi:hypothetical protein
LIQELAKEEGAQKDFSLFREFKWMDQDSEFVAYFLSRYEDEEKLERWSDHSSADPPMEATGTKGHAPTMASAEGPSTGSIPGHVRKTAMLHGTPSNVDAKRPSMALGPEDSAAPAKRSRRETRKR